MRCSTGSVFTLTRPATIRRSAWRGENRMTSAPKRARSKREHAVAISSMPQHAVANGRGHTLERRAQLMTRLSCVVTTLSVGSAASRPIGLAW
jgi:hypothetical protein